MGPTPQGRRASHRVRLPSSALVVGSTLLVAVAAVAVLAPLISPYAPKQGGPDALAAPSLRHLMGTDDLGRDVFSSVIHGARTALIVGFVAAGIALGIGSVVGLVAGYAGGFTDDVLMRIAEVVLLLPRLLLAILVTTAFGGGTLSIVLILGATFWPLPARLIRAQVLSVRTLDFVVAARALGASPRRVLARHIVPNVAGPIAVITATQFAAAVLTEAGLSFLGVGDPSVVSWGQMLFDAQRFLRTGWWLFVFPGVALIVLVLAVSMIADGVGDTLRRR